MPPVGGGVEKRGENNHEMVLLISLQIVPTPLRAFGSGPTQKVEREQKICGKFTIII